MTLNEKEPLMTPQAHVFLRSGKDMVGVDHFHLSSDEESGSRHFVRSGEMRRILVMTDSHALFCSRETDAC